MKNPFIDPTRTEDGWQAGFAFQVFHRKAEDWLKMRWGFNAGALLDEALDRGKLFVESQAISDAEFRSGIQPARTLALRGMNVPGEGLQMGLLGKTIAQSREEVQKTALSYARELYSVFPTDFVLIPAETFSDYERLSGKVLLNGQTGIAQIQRGIVPIPSTPEYHFLHGLWQASSRSNEQIWRALSNMPKQIILNITMQPTFFYEGERRALLEMKSQVPKAEQGDERSTAYVQWIENVIKRRLALWKKFFILQVHVVAEDELDQNLLRSIGSSLTRDAGDLTLPGFQINWPDSELTGRSWCKNILALDFIPASRMEDVVDSDEAFAVFRYPYSPEAGVHGANFMTYREENLPPQSRQGQ